MAGALLGYTAGRQLSQLLAAIVFFHGSEYALAVAFHGKSNITLSYSSVIQDIVASLYGRLARRVVSELTVRRS